MFPSKTAASLCLGVLASLCGASAPAQAAGYPDKPITIIVPFPPGGNIDLSARAVAPSLGATLGQAVVIENRPGAGGTIGAGMVVNSKPDGYTLLVAGSTVSIAPFIYKQASFDPTRDFTDIGGIQTVPMVLTAASKTPVTTLAQLRAFTKSHHGNVTVATSGVGTSPHFALAQIMDAAKLPLVHVPYRGSAPALSDLLGNHVDLMVDQLNTSLPSILDHRIKVIAQLGKSRSPLIPDVPTLAEQGVPGFNVITYVGLFAPAHIPQDVNAKLVSALTTALATPQVKKIFHDMGATPFTMSQTEFTQFVHADIENSKKIAHDLNITVD